MQNPGTEPHERQEEAGARRGPTEAKGSAFSTQHILSVVPSFSVKAATGHHVYGRLDSRQATMQGYVLVQDLANIILALLTLLWLFFKNQ